MARLKLPETVAWRVSPVPPIGPRPNHSPLWRRRSIDAALLLPANDRLVLFVGNPQEARKRYQLAQQAVATLNQTLPAKLILAWLTPHQNIPIFMSACDVLVFTSFQEGSPNVVKEALACNLPVVSVAVGDVPQRLRGISGCEVCDDDRPETIAAALERVLRRGQRIQGRETVQHLDERLTTAKLIDVYRSVLASRSGAGSNGSLTNDLWRNLRAPSLLVKKEHSKCVAS